MILFFISQLDFVWEKFLSFFNTLFISFASEKNIQV